jgi:hypothetical protein
MQVIHRTIPMPARTRLRDGRTVEGVLRFEAQIYAPGEEGSVWRGSRSPSTAAEWLRQTASDGTVVIEPPPMLVDIPPVRVPAAVLRALASEQGVVMEWSWVKTR